MANKTITSPRGFRVAAVKAGIKASGNLDLGLIIADKPCNTAGVFTTNKICSATIDVCRSHVSNGKIQAVFVNAGNANAATGQQGLEDAQTICTQIASKLNIKSSDVMVNSTGIIGHFMPMDKVAAGIDKAFDVINNSETNGLEFSQAIMTTDLTQKLAFKQIKLDGKVVKVAGTAKGSGMIAPNMATMLGFVTTDADIKPAMLKKALREVASMTFNKVSVDNHQSTNDSLIVMASGMAGNNEIAAEDENYQIFKKALWQVCDDLARQIAADGEGATCAVTVRVNSAATAKDATKAVRAIVDSPLVRTAFNGADPNWGRIVSAVGYSGAKFDLSKLTCKIAGKVVYRNGQPVKFDPATLSAKMKHPAWLVEVDLGAGQASDFCYTCDLSKGYVTINADYHT
ncbi:MAG: bifunctional glutamate N-acetyltransferase/amino-acid acetyltransferase ArgJ [Phycisphaerae bacterium]|nr:bifunctional glutamate N-acetyltransferase/amino-acid acetyltransferase ArgJ [Phycisphaerae bacterium]